MLRFACPQCHKAIQVEDSAAGKKLKCPQCGGALAMPAGKQSCVAALPKAEPLAAAAPQTDAAAPCLPLRNKLSELPPLKLLDAAAGPMVSVAGGSRRSLTLPLSIGGVVLVGAAVAVTLLATGYMSHPKTGAGGHSEDGVELSAGLPASSPGGALANPAAQAAPAGGAPLPAVPAAPGPAPAPAAMRAPAPGAAERVEVVDVLRQINPVRDSVRGAWTFQGSRLASPRNEAGTLRLPVTPPAEYRLTVVVERASSPRPSKTAKARPPATGSDEGLHIVLSVDGHPAALVLDGWHRTTSGLELIDGRGADQNGTAFHGEILARYRTVTVVCTVGPGSVDATADGRTIVHWTGRSDRLSIEPGLAADIGHGLGLISSSQFRIRRIELAPLSGTALPVGPPAVAASTGPAAGPAAQAPPPPAGLPAAPGPAAPASQVAVAAATPAPALAPARAKPARPTAVPSPQALQCVALIEHPLGSGSGFAIGKKLVVTNAHVVEAVFADEIKVRFGTENSKPQPVARILYFDRPRDLCVLELKQSELAGLPVRGDYAFNSGDRVTLVGNPTAGGGILMRNAVNHGRFSGVVRIKEQDFYQIDASVNPGWSGGPVLDDEGRVVAIVAMKAADKAVTELRGAMGKLDQEFRTRIGRTGYNIGLTYGIPAGALGNVLKDPDFHDEDRQAEANDRCAARALADRLSFLAVLSMLRVQINVPAKVRLEAASLAHGKTLAGSHRRPAPGEVLTFMPHPEAARLGRVLDSDSLKSLESKFQDRLDERIDAIQASAYLGDVVKRDLRTLAAKVREANKFAEHPPATYAAFSVKVKGFSHDFKEHLKRLAEYLKEKEEERE